MAVGDFTPWTVLYKAVADFSDLIAEAAKARAEMAALTKDMNNMSKQMTAGVNQNVAAQKNLVTELGKENQALDQAARGAQQYNQQVLYGGRRTMDQRLADLQKQTTLQNLLNRSKQRGFITPQQDYAFRQREYQAQLLWNRAEQQGYATPDQYLGYLAKERSAFDRMTQAWRDRDAAIRGATTAAVTYAGRVGGTKISPAGLSTSTDRVNALGDALSGLPDQVTTSVRLDDGAAATALASYGEALDDIPDTINTAANFDDASALAAVAAYASALAGIPDVIHTRVDMGKLPTLGGDPVNLNVNPVFGKISAPHLATINENINQRFSSSGTGNDAKQMAALSASMAGYVTAAHNASNASTALSSSLSTGTHNASALGAAAGAAAGGGGINGGGLSGLAAAADNSGNSARRAYGWWGLLTKKIDLFGGAHEIGLWHILLDLAIEFAAVLVPAAVTATIGLGAYALAAAKSYEDVYKHLQAVYTVTTATGQAIPPMTDRFAKLQAAIQPDVLQQYGDALIVMNHQGSLFGLMATQTGGILDRFSARVTNALTSGGGAMQKFVKTGESDLAAFGTEASALGTIFMNLVKASEITHVAEDILALFAAVLKVTAAFTNMVGPETLAVGIGLHAVYVYGGLLVTALKNVGIGFAGLGSTIGKMTGNFAGLSDKSYSLAKALGASDDKLATIASRSKGIQAISKATGIAANELGQFAVQNDKAGVSVYELARKSASGQKAIFEFGQGLDKAGTDAVALAGYMGRSGPEIEKVGQAMAGASVGPGKMEKALSQLEKIPIVGWVAIGVAAVGAFAYEFIKARDSADLFIDAINTNVANAPLLAIFPTLTFAIQTVRDHLLLASAEFKENQATLNSWGKTLGNAAADMENFGGSIQILHGLGALVGAPTRALSLMADQAGVLSKNFGFLGPGLNSMAHGSGALNSVWKVTLGTLNSINPAAGKFAASLLNSGAKATDAAHQLTAYQQEQVKLYEGQQLAKLRIDAVANAYGTTLTGALALASQAGVRSKDLTSESNTVWKTSLTMIQGMVEGYKAMGQQGGMLGKDLDAVTYASSSQLAAMTKLNSAWDTFTQNVAAPRSSFLGFDQALIGFSQDAAAAGAQMTGLGHGVSALAKPVSNTAITLQQSFQSVYSSAETMLDAMRTAGAPAGVFEGVAKNLVQVMLPLAGKSKAARAEVSALAQEAGGPASSSIKELSAWAGKTKTPLKAMQDATDAETIALSSLSKDAVKASGIIQNDLIASTAAYAENLFHLKPLQDAYLASLKENGPDSAKTKAALDALTKAQQNATKYVQQATTAQDDNRNAQQQNQEEMKQGQSLMKLQVSWLVKNHQNQTVVTNDLQDYTKQIDTNTAQTSAGVASRKQLIQDYINAGDTSVQANHAVANYTAQIQANKDETSGAHNVRQQLVQDFINAHTWSGKTKDALNTYTQYIKDNTDRTDAGRNARKTLIADLEHTGINAHTATRLVDNLSTSIKNIPKTKSLSIGVTGGGKYKITQTSAGPNPIFKTVPTKAEGGPIVSDGRPFQRQAGYVDMTAGLPGRDSVPAIVMPGEYVVKQAAVSKYGRANMEALNNMQFAAGGMVPQTGCMGPLCPVHAGGKAGKAGPHESYGVLANGRSVNDAQGGQGSAGRPPPPGWAPAMWGPSSGAKGIPAFVSGGEVAQFAQHYNGVPYVWGGGSPSGWDCSGFSAWVYQKFGFFPGAPGSRYGTSESQWSSNLLQPAPAQAGALAFFDDHVLPFPGHVGVALGPNSMISAEDEALGTRQSSLAGAAGFRIPRKGFKTGHDPTGGWGGGGSGGLHIAMTPLIKSLTGSIHHSGQVSNSQTSQAFPELGDFHTRAYGDAVAMAQYNMEASMHNAIAEQLNASGGGNANFKGGPFGKAIYSFILGNIFSGNRTAAAGALASMWGESGWNPESAGTGGDGIMGWTPPPPGLVTGNATRDMNTQLDYIKPWLQRNGDMGHISEMMRVPKGNVLAAANIWGPEIEKFGINDVHPEGVQLATQIAGLAAGGLISPAAMQKFFSGGDVVKAVKQATSDAHVRESMLEGAYLSSRWNPGLKRKGGFLGAWGVGPGKQPNPKMSKTAALNPYQAAKQLAPYYTATTRRAGFAHQPADAKNAFLMAQHLNPAGFSGSATTAGWKQTLAALTPAMTGSPIPAPSGKTGATWKWETKKADGKHTLAQLAKATDPAVPWKDVIGHNTWAEKYLGRHIPKGYKVQLPFATGASKTSTGKPLPNQDGGQKWEAAENALIAAFTTEKSKMLKMDSASTAGWFPVRKGLKGKDLSRANKNRAALVKRAQHDETELRTRQGTLNTAMNKIVAAKSNGRNITEHEWDVAGTSITDLRHMMGHVPLLYANEKDRARNAWSGLDKLTTASRKGHNAWSSLWGPDGSLMPKHYAGTPGPGGLGGVGDIPHKPVLSVPSLSSLLPGSPVAAPTFAAGGMVMSAAMPSMPSSNFASVSMPSFADGGSVDKPNPVHTRSAAAQSVGGDHIGIQGDVHIHNPKQERVSESIARTVQRTAFLAGRGMS